MGKFNLIPVDLSSNRFCFIRFGTGGRQERKDVTKGPGVGHYHKDLIEAPKSTKGDMSKNVRFKRGANEVASAAWPSPAAYKIPEIKGPSYSLGSRFEEKRTPMYRKADGSRFDSQIRSKPHLHPKKVDGPGPGDYEAPSSIKKNTRNAYSLQRSTFGGSPKHANKTFSSPGPAHYQTLIHRAAD